MTAQQERPLWVGGNRSCKTVCTAGSKAAFWNPDPVSTATYVNVGDVVFSPSHGFPI